MYITYIQICELIFNNVCFLSIDNIILLLLYFTTDIKHSDVILYVITTNE